MVRRIASLVVLTMFVGCRTKGAVEVRPANRPVECDDSEARRPIPDQILLAMIRACPGALNLSLNVPETDAPLWQDMRSAWLERVDAADASADALVNASEFFLWSEPGRSVSLLKRAVSLQPPRADLRAKLGDAYGLGRTRASAMRAYMHMTIALQLAEPTARLRYLIDAAEAALRASYLDQADRWAREALERATAAGSDWKSVRALHHGHIIRGKVALSRHDRKGAALHLRTACTAAPPTLHAPMPDMTLAAALLSLGEDDAVRAYLRGCARSYMMTGAEMEAWATQTEKALRKYVNTR